MIVSLKLLFFFIVLTHCSTYQPGPTNRDREQDKMCYAKYGGEIGYCDKTGEPK